MQAFVIDAQPDEEVTFSVRSGGDVAVEIVDGTGYSLAETDDNESGTESITATLDGAAPFLLLVEQFSDEKARVGIEGEVALTPLSDPDDAVTLEVPARRAGAIDYPYDVDYYLLPLAAGETVRVRVDSTRLRSTPSFASTTRDSAAVTEDDDSGGGLFGLNAELVYQAEDDRVHRIVINDQFGEVGGYTLTIEAENSRPGEP